MHGLHTPTTDRLMKHKTLIAIAVIVLGMYSGFCDTLKEPVTRADLIGVWIGYSQGGGFFIRMDLNENGGGNMQIVYPKSTVDNYSLDSWNLENGRLRVKLKVPTGDPTGKVRIEVLYVDDNYCETEITFETGGAMRRATLYKEAELLRKRKLAEDKSRK